MRRAIVAALLVVAIATPAGAQGWEYFKAHIHRTGKCGVTREVGASVYNEPGKKTASGEMFSARAHLAASSTVDGWPLGSHVTIINPRNGKTLSVRVNDVLPHKIHGHPNPSWAAGVRLDLTPAAHKALGMRASDWVCAS